MARNLSGWVAIIFNAPVANRSYRFPDEMIPDGIAVVIRARPSNVGETFIAPSSDAASSVTSGRVRLEPGQDIRLHINNTKLIYGSVDTGNDGWEIVYERDG